MVYNCSMANKKTVSQNYVKKQFSIVGIALMIYALVVIFMPIGTKICVENGLFPRIDNPKLSFIISFIGLIIGTVFPFMIVRRVFGTNLKEFTKKTEIDLSDYLINFVVYFGFVAAALYVNTIITKLLGVQGIMLSDVGIVFNEILVDSPIYLFTFIFLSPLLEEYAFRGVLLNSLSKYGRYFALMMTTIVYTLAHASISEMIPSFVMGYLLAKMTLTYKSIRPSLFTHIMGNALLCAFALVPEKYSIFSLVFIAILLILAIILVFSKKYNIISIGSSDSSKRAIKFFLSNIFVIIALLLFVMHTTLITLLKF